MPNPRSSFPSRIVPLALLLSAATTCSAARAQPPAAPTPPAAPLDWAKAEAPFLTGHIQLTKPEMFLKAGEAYFDHESPARWVIFQAIPRPAKDAEPETHYSMYVAKLKRDAQGNVTGLDEPIRVSNPGSYNTCGWFHPTLPGLVAWGSTQIPPTMTDAPGWSKDKKRYAWQFPPETEIVRRGVEAVWQDAIDDALKFYMDQQPKDKNGKPADPIAKPTPPAKPFYLNPADPTVLFSREGYDAEGSYSRDGRFYLYTHVDPADNDPNLWIFDNKTNTHIPIVMTKGYDGGPFFHPDFPHTPLICYRSDRRGDNNLQLYVGEIAFDDKTDGSKPTGLKKETQITDDGDIVNWCPFWNPAGSYMVYASSASGHQNYEVYAIEYQWNADPKKARRARVTTATGFDGLPVFSADGKTMMWTSQRGPKLDGEKTPSSQLWIAKVTAQPKWEVWTPPAPKAPPAAPAAPAPTEPAKK